MLIDHDPCSNYVCFIYISPLYSRYVHLHLLHSTGNWTYSAGGCRSSRGSIFSSRKTGTRYDKNEVHNTLLKEISNDVPARVDESLEHGIVLSSGGTEEDSKRVSAAIRLKKKRTKKKKRASR